MLGFVPQAQAGASGLRPLSASETVPAGVPDRQTSATGDGPCGDSVFLIVFVPGLTPERRKVPTEGPRADRPPAGGGVAGPQESDVEEHFDDLTEDLRLWDYSPSLNDDLRRILPHRLATASVPLDAAPKLPPVDGCVWEPRRCRVETWDIGIDLGVVLYRLHPAHGATWRQVRGSVLADEVRQHLLVGVASLFRCDTDASIADGAPLWVQAMFVVRPAAERPVEQLHDIADELTDGGKRLRLSAEEPDEVLWLGDSACAVSRRDASGPVHALGRVIAAQTAIWAAAIDLERQLGKIVDGGSSEAETLPLNKLEERGVDVLKEYDRVQRFRAGVDSVAVHLALPDREVWECVDGAWPLKRQLGLLDSKISAAEHVYGHMTTTVATRQARFLNGVVLGVTCLSLATFLLTVWQFTRTRFGTFDVISLSVAVLAAGVAAAFYFDTHRRSRRKVARRSRIEARRVAALRGMRSRRQSSARSAGPPSGGPARPQEPTSTRSDEEPGASPRLRTHR